MHVKIMIGISNSGKSTFARENYPAPKSLNAAYTHIFSADHWFEGGLKPYTEMFDPNELPHAHAACLRKFNNAICNNPVDSSDPLVVDNTNTTIAEIAPYAALALAYYHELELVVVHCPLDVALSRDNGHGTPEIAIRGQYKRLEKLLKKHPEKGYFLELPRWWPVREVPYVGGSQKSG